jgi:hypothetical protein
VSDSASCPAVTVETPGLIDRNAPFARGDQVLIACISDSTPMIAITRFML